MLESLVKILNKTRQHWREFEDGLDLKNMMSKHHIFLKACCL